MITLHLECCILPTGGAVDGPKQKFLNHNTKMKKTLFALLTCATLVAPAMADYWYGTITLSSIPAIDTAKLFGDGDYSSDDFSGEYSSDDLASITTSGTAITLSYVVDGETRTRKATMETITWNENACTIPLNAYYWNEVKTLSGTLTLNIKPNAFNALVVAGKDYTDAVLTANVSIPSTTANAGTSETARQALTATVSSYTLSGSKTAATPEPATATLSLLALAGLAVRRRRH